MRDISATGIEGEHLDFEVLLLGPVAVRRAGRELPVTALKHRMILAALGLRSDEAVSTDELIDIVWGDHPPATATKALQVYVSELRKLIEIEPSRPRVLTSQPPGYRLALSGDAVDLDRFERSWLAGREALAGGKAGSARGLLADGLRLWRGEPLADLRFEDAFAADIRRLEELRIACVEDRIDADLAIGDQARVIPELEQRVREFPLRERLRGQLMLALYRAGRQADALAAYQAARERLVDELGIDPSPALATLERRILQQDPALAIPSPEPARAPLPPPPARTLVVVSQSSRDLDALTDVAEAITTADICREFVLARVVERRPDQDPTERLRGVTRRLIEQRDRLALRSVAMRVAAFTSNDPARDLLKLAEQQGTDLLLIDGSGPLLEGRFGIIDTLIRDASCDIAMHLARDTATRPGALAVPFAGSEHDWAALELAVLLARSSNRPLILVGADGSETGTDASRLLATASLIIQRIGNVIAEPVLVAPGARGILAIAEDAHIITGLSARFREDGLGETRFQVAREAPGPVTFVRRGTRPGVLSPPAAITRFTWTLARH